MVKKVVIKPYFGLISNTMFMLDFPDSPREAEN